MKTKLSIFSFILLAVGTLSAHVITVSNNSITAGHFTNLQQAIDSAHVGDTVYVMGSPTTYVGLSTNPGGDASNIYITTQITLIGAGYAVTGTQYNYASIVNSIYIDSSFGGNKVSGTKVMGMDIASNFDYNSTSNINDIDLERCYVGGQINVYGSNWLIHNNDINYIDCQYEGNIYIQNNFIVYIQYSSATTVVIDHNNFVTDGSSYFYNIQNALITNNIFWFGRPDNGSYISGNTFSNNVCTNSSPIVLPPAGNAGSNDTTTAASYFNGSVPSSTVGQNAIWNYNWTIKTSSLIHNRGTDGTDPGVYGGSYPMPNLTCATRIPQMTLMNVGGVAPAGGNLNVNFKAKVQN